jgi:hypothetical protein
MNYYSHWCATSLPKDLFWGPAHALNYVRMQKRVGNETGWLDEVWTEGGAVTDPRDELKREVREDIFERAIRLYLQGNNC